MPPIQVPNFKNLVIGTYSLALLYYVAIRSWSMAGLVEFAIIGCLIYCAGSLYDWVSKRERIASLKYFALLLPLFFLTPIFSYILKNHYKNSMLFMVSEVLTLGFEYVGAHLPIWQKILVILCLTLVFLVSRKFFRRNLAAPILLCLLSLYPLSIAILGITYYRLPQLPIEEIEQQTGVEVTAFSEEQQNARKLLISPDRTKAYASFRSTQPLLKSDRYQTKRFGGIKAISLPSLEEKIVFNGPVGDSLDFDPRNPEILLFTGFYTKKVYLLNTSDNKIQKSWRLRCPINLSKFIDDDRIIALYEFPCAKTNNADAVIIDRNSGEMTDIFLPWKNFAPLNPAMEAVAKENVVYILQNSNGKTNVFKVTKESEPELVHSMRGIAWEIHYSEANNALFFGSSTESYVTSYNITSKQISYIPLDHPGVREISTLGKNKMLFANYLRGEVSIFDMKNNSQQTYKIWRKPEAIATSGNEIFIVGERGVIKISAEN